MAVAGAALGSHRLSVRNRVERPSPSNSAFAQSLDFENLPISSDAPEWRSIGEGETARIATVADGIDCFNAYLDNKEHAGLVLGERDSGDIRVLPYNHRWTAKYRDMVYAKLKAAERALDRIFGEGPTPTTLLTLTAHQTDEKGNPRPPMDVLDDLVNGWENFRKALRRALPDWVRTEYIKVVEPHKSGYPHLHVVIFGIATPVLQEKVEQLWVEKYGAGGADAHENAVEVARGRTAQLQNPAQYLMKYLSKTAVRSDGSKPTSQGFEAFSALLLISGNRQYSTSAGLAAAMKRPPVGDGGNWEFLGIGYGLEPGRYVGEEAEQLENHLKTGPWRPPPGSAVAGHVIHQSVVGNE